MIDTVSGTTLASESLIGAGQLLDGKCPPVEADEYVTSWTFGWSYIKDGGMDNQK